jgi:predicted RNA-binding protein YlqC (UPF0109 family)
VEKGREHLRDLVRIEARYQDLSNTIIKGKVKNISKGGVFIETAHPLDKDCILTMSFDAVDFGKIIDIQGKVVRVIPGKGMAVRFTDQENKDTKLLMEGIEKLNKSLMINLSRIVTKP